MKVTNEILFKQLNNSLLSSTNKLSEIVNRLSTGFNVVSAKDSPADYAIITDLKTKISSFDVACDNIEQGMSMLSLTEGTLENMNDLLERIRELALMACNGTCDADSLYSIQAEIDYCSSQIESMNKSLQFEGINLFQNVYTLNKNKSYYIPQGAVYQEITTSSTPPPRGSSIDLNESYRYV